MQRAPLFLTSLALTALLIASGCGIAGTTFPRGGGDNATGNNGFNNGGNNDANNASNNDGSNNNTNNGANNDNNDAPLVYAAVLIEDFSLPEPGDEAPGVDIDAICIDRDGEELCAENAEDFDILGNDNNFTDVRLALGPPDSGCEAENFVSLGGMGGYIVVSFGEMSIESGDEIVVFELGPSLCPEQSEWVDDEYDVSLSVSVTCNGDADCFEFIGSGGPGQNVFVVP